MSQSAIIRRIEKICSEFDARASQIGIAAARLELAKVLAETEDILSKRTAQFKGESRNIVKTI